MHRAQQPHGERPAGSQTGSSGNVRHANHLDGSRDFVEFQNFANQRMANLIHRNRVFE